MSTRTRRGICLAAAATAVVALGACGSSDDGSGGASGDAGGDGPLVIGMSASKTGPYAVDGLLSLNGTQAAVEEINANGGWLGRKLELKVIDDQSDATKAQQAYQKLITQDKVDFIIGPYAPDLAAAAGAVATRYQYVMLDPETALPIVADSKWAIQAEPSASQNMDGFPAVVKKAGYNSIAILGINNAYGDACVGGIKDEAQDAGLDVVYTTSYSPDDNLASAAEAVKARKADAVASCSFFSDGVSITRALNQAGYAPKMFGLTIAPSEEKYAASVGKLADRVISNTSWAASFETEGNKAFIDRYTKMFGEPPDYHGANNYAAVQALGAAVEQTKSTDQQKILDALYANTYKTVLGTFKLAPNAVTTGYEEYLYQLQDGKQKLIHPPDVAEAEVQTPYSGS
jgi:branched-chain amino acid transport system substrate-binding protein